MYMISDILEINKKITFILN